MLAPGIVFEAPDQGAGSGYNGQRAIDFEHLQRQTMGDASLEAEVLQLFARQARCCMHEMAEGDVASIAASAHKLKGAASAVGAFPVSSAAERLENAPGDEGLMASLDAAVTTTENFIMGLCR